MGCHFLLLQGVFPTQGLNPCTLQVSCPASGFFTTEPLGKHLGNLQLIWEKGPCPSLLYSLSIATSFIPRFQSSKYQLSILLQNSFCGLRCLIFTQANIKDEGISLHTILCYSYKGQIIGKWTNYNNFWNCVLYPGGYRACISLIEYMSWA